MNSKDMAQIADKVNKQKDSIDRHRVYVIIMNTITSVAESGQYNVSIDIDKLKCSSNVITHIIDRLKCDGYKVNKDRIVTAQYSAEDCDEEDVLNISWA